MSVLLLMAFLTDFQRGVSGAALAARNIFGVRAVAVL